MYSDSCGSRLAIGAYVWDTGLCLILFLIETVRVVVRHFGNSDLGPSYSARAQQLRPVAPISSYIRCAQGEWVPVRPGCPQIVSFLHSFKPHPPAQIHSLIQIPSLIQARDLKCIQPLNPLIPIHSFTHSLRHSFEFIHSFKAIHTFKSTHPF